MTCIISLTKMQSSTAKSMTWTRSGTRPKTRLNTTKVSTFHTTTSLANGKTETENWYQATQVISSMAEQRSTSSSMEHGLELVVQELPGGTEGMRSISEWTMVKTISPGSLTDISWLRVQTIRSTFFEGLFLLKSSLTSQSKSHGRMPKLTAYPSASILPRLRLKRNRIKSMHYEEIRMSGSV